LSILMTLLDPSKLLPARRVPRDVCGSTSKMFSGD
jgi:hypothetical protein